MAIEVIVKGRVQRVGYRGYLLDVAQELGVMGFVENLRDGSVRVFCQDLREELQEGFGAMRHIHGLPEQVQRLSR